jgi:starch synthase
MRILHLTSEYAPIAKVGGLGDVVYGLAQEQSLQDQVSVMMPFYKGAELSLLTDLKVFEQKLSFRFDDADHEYSLWQAYSNQVKILLVEIKHPQLFFQRPQVYGYLDDSLRFLSFLQAASSWLKVHAHYDIIHLHDWPTAALSSLLKSQNHSSHIPTLLTLHNIEHQGKLTIEEKTRAHLPFSNANSLLAIGLHSCDGISAVSPQYLKEIQTSLGGHGLDHLVAERMAQVPSAGIVNGIDETYWDPRNPIISSHFDKHHLKFNEGSAQCTAKQLSKKILQEELNLELIDTPLVVCVSRLVPQKGLNLIEQGLYRTIEKGGQFVLLGTSPIAEVQQYFQQLQHHFQSSKNARLLLTYNEPLALKVFSAADLVLVPSLFEPCGLTQLIGFHFGALAVARETGGLKDTVIDVDHHLQAQLKGNGFGFEHSNAEGLNYALDRALNYWYAQPSKWQQWVQRVCQIDVSWRLPTAAYSNLYHEIIAKFNIC